MQEKNIMLAELVSKCLKIQNNEQLAEVCRDIIRSWQGQIVQTKQGLKPYSSRTGVRDFNKMLKLGNKIKALGSVHIKVAGCSMIFSFDSSDLEAKRLMESLSFEYRLRQLTEKTEESVFIQWDLAPWQGTHLTLSSKLGIY
jgi:hypothetical protein